MINVTKIFKLVFVFSIVLTTGISTPASGQEVDNSLLKEYEWRNIGPANMGGRIVDIEAVESKPKIVYAAAATGGLWKTVNAGISWEAVFKDEAISNLGDIGLSQSNPDILYVGTGEPNGRNSSSYGRGVYKSTDAGESWNFVGLENTYHIGRVVVHPANPEIVYVAAMGKLWANNEDRGLYKSTNGGRTWQKVLYINEMTGVTDIALNPRNPNIVYAASYERIRDAFSAGDPVKRWGPGSGIWVSSDAGRNWKRVTQGLPMTEMGRIGLSASRSKPGTVYAIIETSMTPKTIPARWPEERKERRRKENEKTEADAGGIAFGGIYRSDDNGNTWTRVSTYNSRPFYYSQIRVDPKNNDILWIGGTQLGFSEDGGKTVKTDISGNTHVDYHAAWINPNDPEHVIIGSDGGVHYTYDRGKKWDSHTQMSLAQFYAITADMRKPYYVYGGLQDNGSWGGPSRTRSSWGILNENWYPVGFGDGFFMQIDPTDFNIVYYESQYGNPGRVDLRTGINKSIRPSSANLTNHKDKERYRFDWNSPMLISPHNPRTIYYGGNRLFKSLNRGDNWTAISEDLTNNKEWSRSNFTAIVSVDESPLKPGLVWAGTNDGNVWVTKNDGTNWQMLNNNIPGAPKNYWVKRLEASNHEEGRAYLVYDGHRNDDRNPYIYMTNDYGQTWERINNNLPEAPVYVVREDYNNPDLLFAGTEHYVYISLDRGKNWTQFSEGMPNVPIHDLYIHPRDGDLIAGTHGRGAWVLDNITPLQQIDEEITGEPAHLFDIRPELKFKTIFQFPFITDKTFRVSNPQSGSTIHYYLGSEASDSIKVEILGISGDVLKTLKGSPEKGINKINWDFRFDRGVRMTNSSGRRITSAEPGEYLVRFEANGKTFTKKMVVEEDFPGYLGKD